MIHLRGASCSLARPSAPLTVLLAPTDLDIPSDASIALLGGTADARTAILHLIARRTAPDTGTVTHDRRVSPIINDERLLHPALTVLANLRFIARAQFLDERLLMRAVDRFCGLALLLSEQVRSLDGGQRRTLEAAIVAALPYELVLLDNAQQMPLPTIAFLRDAARMRGAGLIFASAGPRPARLHADLAVFIEGDRLRLEPDPSLAASRIEREAA